MLPYVTESAAPYQRPLSSAASYLIYSNMRLHIPMTHNDDRYDGPDGASDNRSGPVLFNTTSHMMALYDVGMTANLASDMLALVRLGDAWCGAAAGTTAVPHTTPCGQSTKVKIATLRQRAELLATLTRDHLWNEDVGTFTNKLPAVRNLQLG